MDDLDLNIQNYDLEDILNLFKLNYQFTEQNLKQAYKTVLKTHPDKSGLDKEVFLFLKKRMLFFLRFIILEIEKKNALMNKIIV